MRLFHNDYNAMCHSAVLDKINAASDQSMGGYGEDPCCQRAAARIRELCGREDLFVHFLVGGTQTNLTVIDAALRPHQAAICAATGHIHVHETGAIEATGHKVVGLPHRDGKITAQQVLEAYTAHWQDVSHEHIPQPKLVYISNSTELGTIYTLAELQQLREVCDQCKMYLFVDGARLGYALAAKDNDVTLKDLAQLADVFYIGGTKVGAMFGEAVVISRPEIAEDFRYLIKQHGGMLAKGWLLGLQFEALLEEDLYLRIASHADQMADHIRGTLKALDCPLLVPGETNQIFPILPDSVLAQLSEEFTFSEQERVDESHRAVRFCTSWATKQADVDALCDALKKLLKR